MIKKIAATAVCLLAFATAHATPVPPVGPTQTSLIQLANLGSVHVKWDNGIPLNVDSPVEFGSPGKDLLYIDIPADGDYTFKLVRPAAANWDASFKLIVDVGGSPVSYNSVESLENNTKVWTFSNVSLLDKNYLFDLTVNLTARSAGNPEFSGYLQGGDVPDTPTDSGNIPEPASLALLGTGLLGLAALRRRRKE